MLVWAAIEYAERAEEENEIKHNHTMTYTYIIVFAN